MVTTIIAVRHARGDLADPMIHEGNPHLNVNTAPADIYRGASIVIKEQYSAFYAGEYYRMRETAFGLKLLLANLPEITLTENLDAYSTYGPDGRIYPIGSTEPWDLHVRRLREFLADLAEKYPGGRVLWVCSGVHLCVLEAEQKGLSFSSNEEMQSWALNSEAGKLPYCSVVRVTYDERRVTSFEALT